MKEYINAEHQSLSEHAESLDKSIKRRTAALPHASKANRGKGYDTEHEAMTGTIARETKALDEVNNRIKEIEKAASKPAKAPKAPAQANTAPPTADTPPPAPQAPESARK